MLHIPTSTTNLSDEQREAVSDILRARANEIAIYKEQHRDAPDAVHEALVREIGRIRDLASSVYSPDIASSVYSPDISAILEQSNPFYK